jgi:hypothetical protein
MTAQQLVGVVAAEYYREEGSAKQDGLRPLMDVIERAHPGVVELVGTADKPGFAVRLAERPFPKRYEAELKKAVEAMATLPASPVPRPGLWQRVVGAVRRLFRG